MSPRLAGSDSREMVEEESLQLRFNELEAAEEAAALAEESPGASSPVKPAAGKGTASSHRTPKKKTGAVFCIKLRRSCDLGAWVIRNVAQGTLLHGAPNQN